MAGKGYTKDGKVSFRDQSGGYVWVPVGEVQNAVNEGLQAESPEEYHERSLRKEADTFAGKAETFGKGLLSSATMGVSDWVEHQGPGATFENTQRRAIQKEENPWSNIGGQVSGMLTPGGLVSGAGKLGAKVGMKALQKASANIASKQTAQAAAKIAGTSLIEGAATGAGSAIGEQGFTGEFDATEVAKRAATDMVISGAMTAGLMGVGKGIKGAYGAAKNRLYKSTGVDHKVQDELLFQHSKMKEELDQFDTIKNDQGMPVRKEIEMNQHNMEVAAKDIRAAKEQIAGLKKQQMVLRKQYERDIKQAQKDWDTIRADDAQEASTLAREAKREAREAQKSIDIEMKEKAKTDKVIAKEEAQLAADKEFIAKTKAEDSYLKAKSDYSAAKKKSSDLAEEFEEARQTGFGNDPEGSNTWHHFQDLKKASEAAKAEVKKLKLALAKTPKPPKSLTAKEKRLAQAEKNVYDTNQRRLAKIGQSDEQLAKKFNDPHWLASKIDNNKPNSPLTISAKLKLEEKGIKYADIVAIPKLKENRIKYSDIGAIPISVEDVGRAKTIPLSKAELARLSGKRDILDRGETMAREQIDEVISPLANTPEEMLYAAKKAEFGGKIKDLEAQLIPLNRRVEANQMALEIAEKRAGKVAARYGIDEVQLAKMAAAPKLLKQMEETIHNNRKALWSKLGGAFQMGGLGSKMGWGLSGGFLGGEGFSIKGAMLGLVARRAASILGGEGAMNVAHGVYRAGQKAKRVAKSGVVAVGGKGTKKVATNEISSNFRVPRYGALTILNKKDQEEMARSYDLQNGQALANAAYEGLIDAGIDEDIAREMQTYYIKKSELLSKAAKKMSPIAFSKLYHAANEPAGIVKRLRRKSATREDIVVLRELFTDTYYRLVAEAQNIQRNNEDMTSRQRSQIKIILAPEEPDRINQAISQQAQKEKAQQQKPPGGQATQAAVQAQTPMQRIAKGQM